MACLRSAFVQLARTPGLTLAITLILGAGLGLNVCLFSVYDQLVLRPPAAHNLDSLLVVLEADPAHAYRGRAVAPADFVSWRRQARAFSQLAASESRPAQLGSLDTARTIRVGRVTAGYFQTLGVPAFLGRTFTADEDNAGADPGVISPIVLSHELWRSVCNADAAILGRSLRIDGIEHVVIGVMPSGFGLPRGMADLWLPRPFVPAELALADQRSLTVVGRLHERASLAQAKTELDALLAADHPVSDPAQVRTVNVMPARRWAVEDIVRRFSELLLAAAGFVLVAACANVANLQIARGLSRRSEFAIRRALGASRWALIRQVLAESLLQAVLAAIVGVLLAVWLLALIQSRVPPEITAAICGWSGLTVDAPALAVALLLALGSAVLSGLLPALWLSSAKLSGSLRSNLDTRAAPPQRHRVRHLLAVCQIALTLLLLTGATTMVDGFARRAGVSRDFAPATLLTVRLDLPRTRLSDEEIRRAAESARSRLAELPQVASAALAGGIPFRRHGGSVFEAFRSERPLADGATTEDPYALIQPVSDDYFRALNVRLLAGRLFSAADREGSVPVVVVSESLARLLAADVEVNASPIGRLIQVGPPNSAEPWLQVIGVVSDVPHFAIQPEPSYTCYRPLAQMPRAVTTLLVRTRIPAADATTLVASTLSGSIAGHESQIVTTMDQVIAGEMAGLAYIATLMSVFAVVCTGFSLAGIYGLIAWFVQERTHELGVRIALGADPRRILGLLVRYGMRIAGWGIGAGVLASAGLALFLSGFLSGAAQASPLLLLALAVGTAVAVALACWLPARRATRVDPIVALRAE